MFESIIRPIREWWRPELKCKRVGHDMKTTTIKIRKEGGSFRAVVTDYKAKIDYCDRCHKKLQEPYDLKEFDSFTGCSMPTSMWDRMREKGYVEV